MDSGGLSGVCSKNATSMLPLFCLRSNPDLFRWTSRCMAVTSSTIFYQTHANNMSWVHDGSEPLILSMIRATHDYYHYWYMFGSPNRGTKQALCGCQEWDVSIPVRFTMLGLSRVQWDNGKCSFVNEDVCTNAYNTYTIWCIQIYSGRTFWLLRLAPLKETLRGCQERSECRIKAGQEWIEHHDTVETWKPGAVVIGLFTPLVPSQSLGNLN